MPQAEMLPSRCNEWPAWLERFEKTSRAPIINEAEVKGGPTTVTPGSLVSYWRPGGRRNKEKWFYAGKVFKAWDVTFPTGKHVGAGQFCYFLWAGAS